MESGSNSADDRSALVASLEERLKDAEKPGPDLDEFNAVLREASNIEQTPRRDFLIARCYFALGNYEEGARTMRSLAEGAERDRHRVMARLFIKRLDGPPDPVERLKEYYPGQVAKLYGVWKALHGYLRDLKEYRQPFPPDTLVAMARNVWMVHEATRTSANAEPIDCEEVAEFVTWGLEYKRILRRAASSELKELARRVLADETLSPATRERIEDLIQAVPGGVSPMMDD